MDKPKFKQVKAFEVWTEELTHEDVTICWTPPRKVAKQDINKFELILTRIGKTDCVKSFKQHTQDSEKEVFKTQIGDTGEIEFSLFGLESSCAYRVVLQLNFVNPDLLTRDYNISIGAKYKDRVTKELYPIQSYPVTLLTTANYDKLLLKKSEWDYENLKRSKKG